MVVSHGLLTCKVKSASTLTPFEHFYFKNPCTSYLNPRSIFNKRNLLCLALDENDTVMQRFGDFERFKLSAGGEELLDLITGLDRSQDFQLPLVQIGQAPQANLFYIKRGSLSFIVLMAAESSSAEIGMQQQVANELALSNLEKQQTVNNPDKPS